MAPGIDGAGYTDLASPLPLAALIGHLPMLVSNRTDD